MKVTDLLQLFGKELDHIEPKGNELGTYSMVKGGVATVLGIFNKFVRFFTDQPSILHWLYRKAYQEIINAAYRHAMEVAKQHGFKEGVFLFRFGPVPEAQQPKLQIMTCGAQLTGTDYKATPIEDGLIMPHQHAERILGWYESRKSPSSDIAKIFVIAQREGKDSSSAQKQKALKGKSND